MERNLESIIEEIAQNEEFSKEFMAMDEIDEIYAYCKEMGLNSSEEEFDEEVSSMIDNFDLNYSKIGDFELENVAGGSMLDKNFNKVVASALSALTIAGAGAANSNFASAANDASASTVSVSASEKTQSAKNIKSSSKMEYTKEKFNKIKNSVLSFCKKHKIAVGATTAAIILAAVYGSVALYKKDANPLHWFGNKTGDNDKMAEKDRQEYLKKREQEDLHNVVSVAQTGGDSLLSLHERNKLTDNTMEGWNTGMDRIDQLKDTSEKIQGYFTSATTLKKVIDGANESKDWLVRDNANFKAVCARLGSSLSNLNTSGGSLPDGVNAEQLSALATYFQGLGGSSS